MDYQNFLVEKLIADVPTGFDPDKIVLNQMLFDFQRDLVLWSLRRGRSALLCDCGLGKTPMQLEWAKHVCAHTGGNVLILAPLAVSRQTKKEGEKFGVDVTICRTQADVKPGVNITNYEMMHNFTPAEFVGIVLDESGILKAYTGKYRTLIIEMWGRLPYRLACTATPAPNDFMELGNHAEFLGVMGRSEMLSMFFINDAGEMDEPKDQKTNDARGNKYSHKVWQRYASPVWFDIRQTNTLNTIKADKDEKHVCPLQLDTIERCLELWSNPGDKVLSPFAGIGSEGYKCVQMGREFIGIELKPAYFEQAVKNLQKAKKSQNQLSIFGAKNAEPNPEAD